jgi:transcriptional regulator with XRE-family HTH domain
MTLGDRLRQLRDMKRLSQDELGQRASVPPSVIADVESGHQATVPLDIAQRLAEALAVTRDSLVGERRSLPDARPRWPRSGSLGDLRPRPPALAHAKPSLRMPTVVYGVPTVVEP